MRELGERGDIVKAINRALAARGQDRGAESFDPAWRGRSGRPSWGRVIDKRLTDELGDRIGVVIDGIDGRVHHVALPDASAAEPAQIGSHRRGRPAPVPSVRLTTTSPRSPAAPGSIAQASHRDTC